MMRRLRPAPVCAFVASLAATAFVAGTARAGDPVVVEIPPAGADAAPAAPAAKRAPRPLRVTKTRPKHGKVRFDRYAEIWVDFSHPVDPNSVNEDTVDLHRLYGDRVKWRPRYERGGKRLVITPDEPLEASADFELLVQPQVESADGRALRGMRRVIFFTGGSGPAAVLLASQFEDLPARMIEGRAAHSATLTSNGEVVLVGGMTNATGFAVTAERFDPATKTFRASQTLMPEPRAFHPAVAVGDGVYMPGGWNGSDALGSTLYYSTPGRSVTNGPSMLEKRDFHAAVALADGRILVTGGLSYGPGGALYSTTAEIFEGGAFRQTANAPVRRRVGHTLTLLDDGRVLVAGGISQFSGFPATCEIFDPATETFREVNAGAYYRQLHTATSLGNGAVLLADGRSAILEIFSMQTEQVTEAGGASFVIRERSTASLLPDGRVLFIGGQEVRGTQTVPLATMDLWDPRTSGGRVFRVTVTLTSPRVQHTATELFTQQILIAGGLNATGQTNYDTATLFTPEEFTGSKR